MKSSDAKAYKYVWRFTLNLVFLSGYYIGFYISTGISEWVEAGILLI